MILLSALQRSTNLLRYLMTQLGSLLTTLHTLPSLLTEIHLLTVTGKPLALRTVHLLHRLPKLTPLPILLLLTGNAN